MYCSNCGKNLNDGVKFCLNCGQKNLGLDTNNTNIIPPVTTKVKLDNEVNKIQPVVPKGFGARFRFIFGKVINKPQFIYITKSLNVWLIIVAIGGSVLGLVLKDGFTLFLNLTAIVPYLLLRNALKRDDGYKIPLIVTLIWTIIVSTIFISSGGRVNPVALFSLYWSIRLLGALNLGVMEKSGSPTPTKQTKSSILYILASIILVGGVLFGFVYWIYSGESNPTPTPTPTLDTSYFDRQCLDKQLIRYVTLIKEFPCKKGGVYVTPVPMGATLKIIPNESISWYLPNGNYGGACDSPSGLLFRANICSGVYGQVRY